MPLCRTLAYGCGLDPHFREFDSLWGHYKCPVFMLINWTNAPMADAGIRGRLKISFSKVRSLLGVLRELTYQVVGHGC